MPTDAPAPPRPPAPVPGVARGLDDTAVRVLAGIGLALAGAASAVAATAGDPVAWAATLGGDLVPVAAWLLAARGLGGWTARGLGLAGARGGAAAAWAFGVAAMLALDGAVLRLTAVPAAAWGLTGSGLLALAAEAWMRRAGGPLRASDEPMASRRTAPPPWPLVLAAAVPTAVLLAAAPAAPGWLWASEFGGYDSLSYHLELPAAWAEAGRATPQLHNVYAFMPNAVEHGFLHVGLLAGEVRTAGTAAHLLHAAMALGAAAATGGLATSVRRRLGGGDRDAVRAGWVAGVLVLATPWTVVTGSLAYTEMAVLWMLAASMRLAADTDDRPTVREGLAHGLLAGVATAAKLTAGPLAVLPAVAWWLGVRRARTRTAADPRPGPGAGPGAGAEPREDDAGAGGLASDAPPERPRDAAARGATPGDRDAAAARDPGGVLRVAAGGALAGLLVLAPWLVAGAAWTGNPVFPFAADVLGRGHWTAEQVAAWRAGHGGGSDLGGLAREWLVHGVAGEEPPQWGVLPLAGLAGLVLLAVFGAGSPARRTAGSLAAALGIALLAWGTLTHGESRFLLPTAVPLAVALGLLAGRGPAIGLGLAVLVAAQATWPAALLARERDGRAGLGVGAGAVLRGEAHAAAMAAARAAGDAAALDELRASAPPAWWTRFGLAADARVLMIGEAAVLHHPPRRIAARTVWDRFALDDWLDEAAEDGGGWVPRARAAGFTHAYVDLVMLANWAERGWNDADLTWETLQARAGAPLEPVATFDGGGRVLLRLGSGEAGDG